MYIILFVIAWICGYIASIHYLFLIGNLTKEEANKKLKIFKIKIK